MFKLSLLPWALLSVTFFFLLQVTHIAEIQGYINECLQFKNNIPLPSWWIHFPLKLISWAFAMKKSSNINEEPFRDIELQTLLLNLCQWNNEARQFSIHILSLHARIYIIIFRLSSHLYLFSPRPLQYDWQSARDWTISCDIFLSLASYGMAESQGWMNICNFKKYSLTIIMDPFPIEINFMGLMKKSMNINEELKMTNPFLDFTI